MPLWPIHRQNRIKRLILSTYQAASGGGAAAMDELVQSTRASLAGESYQPKVLPHPYAFNLFSHNTAVDPETGYNEEETKVIKETRKIFEDDRIAVGVTCVRVPVLRAHSEAITFECERPITEDQVRAILAKLPASRSSTIGCETTSRCRSMPQARTTCWWAASAGISAIPAAIRSRCSWPRTSC